MKTHAYKCKLHTHLCCFIKCVLQNTQTCLHVFLNVFCTHLNFKLHANGTVQVHMPCDRTLTMTHSTVQHTIMLLTYYHYSVSLVTGLQLCKEPNNLYRHHNGEQKITVVELNQQPQWHVSGSLTTIGAVWHHSFTDHKSPK